MKVALSARYSSDNQRGASFEDQLRLCRVKAEREGSAIADSYTDRAMSDASLLRPGVQKLIADALKRRFEVIVTGSLDRLSRDPDFLAEAEALDNLLSQGALVGGAGFEPVTFRC